MNGHSQEFLAGLIFIATEEPVGRLTRAITKQNYNILGFYIPSNVSGKSKNLIYAYDIFGISRPYWMTLDYSIEQLINNQIVTRAIVRPLKYMKNLDGSVNRELTKRLEMKLKLKIVDMINEQRGSLDLRSALFSLFDFRPSFVKIPNVLDLINKVVSCLSEEKNQAFPGSQDSINLLYHAVNNLKNKDNPMELYEFFDTPKEIELPARSSEMVDQVRREIYLYQEKMLSEILATFVNLLLNSNEFFNTVLTNFNEASSRSQRIARFVNDLMLESFDFGDLAADIFSEMLSSGKCSLEEINKFIDKLQEHKVKIGAYLGTNLPSAKKLSCDGDTTVIVTTNTKYSINDKKQAINNLYKLLNCVSQDINENKTPIIDYTALINNFNLLLPENIELTKVLTKGSFASVLSLDTTDQLKINTNVIARQGNSLIFKELSEQQLKDIIAYLEDFSTSDSRFELAKNEAIDELAKRE